MTDVNNRFRAAILSARSLHPDLLTQPQKLKLYALFRQSQGAAPAEPPAERSALSIAKWEAWRDVRSLTQQEAMDAYSEIIEGLVSLMTQFEGQDLSEPATQMPQAPNKHYNPEAEQRPREEDIQEEYDDEEGEEEGEEEYDDEEEYDEEGEEEEEEEPKVSQTVWQTASVNVAAGATFDVPLAFDAPCRCTYSFSIVEGSVGPIAFRISATEGFRSDSRASASPPLVSEYLSSQEGTCEVNAPGAAALRISLDNTASTFSSVDVKVRVCLEPLHELQALEHYHSRQALRGLLARKEAKLEEHTNSYSSIGRESHELQRRLEQLRLQVASVEGELKIKYKQIEQGPRRGTAGIRMLCASCCCCCSLQPLEWILLLQERLCCCESGFAAARLCSSCR